MKWEFHSPGASLSAHYTLRDGPFGYNRKCLENAMNLNKSLELTVKTFYTQEIVKMLPDLPSRRELLIQNGKLLRMLMEPQKHQDRLKSFGGASLRKMRKDEGRRAQLIGQQARKTNDIAEKYFKEFLRGIDPKLTNAEYRIWKAKFDKGIDSHSQIMKAQVTARIVQKLTKDSSS